MKVLITGVNGLVGKAIAKYFHNEKWYVIGTDIAIQGESRYIADFIPADITNPLQINQLEQEIGECDLVIHVAARIAAGVPLIPVNVLGTENIASLACNLRAKKILYISSIQVIGKPNTVPILETHSVNPLTMYHATKYFGEKILSLPEFTSLHPCIFRIPSPIGIDMPTDRILPIFIQNCKNGMPITIQGKGGRVQNYIDTEDIARAAFLSMSTRCEGIYNIVGNSVSNLELAEKCKLVTRSNSPVIFSNRPDPEENVEWRISGEKAKKDFAYEPAIDLETSIWNIFNKSGNA